MIYSIIAGYSSIHGASGTAVVVPDLAGVGGGRAAVPETGTVTALQRPSRLDRFSQFGMIDSA
ncbi:hypothetical protein ABT061_35890 [Streptosporangium sp. NPDC002544]|uniref:hypothetical protein n=1 Tax=Streptosporangium sp. NPDC002544 TaxID=3154538 RepID=UPI003330D51E